MRCWVFRCGQSICLRRKVCINVNLWRPPLTINVGGHSPRAMSTIKRGGRLVCPPPLINVLPRAIICVVIVSIYIE
jgi:hypothetical protein